MSLFTFATIVLTPLASAHASFGDGTPTVGNADLFGLTREVPRVDEPTGAFTQHIRLDIPPGRNGLQPQLSLDYNSQNTEDGILGYGWSLSIPYIERQNKTGSENLYNTPYLMSSIEGELAFDGVTTAAVIATTSPSILDTTPASGLMHNIEGGTSLSFSYTVPSGGQNKMLVVLWTQNNSTDPTALSLNGTSFTSSITRHTESCSPGMANHYFAYLADPTSGTFNMTWSGTTYSNVTVFTVQNARELNPIDVENLTCGTASSKSTSVTTTTGYDLLLSYTTYQSAGALTSFGAGEAQVTNGSSVGLGSEDYVSWKPAGSAAGTETMTSNLDSSRNIDLSVVAVKPYSQQATVSTTTTFRARIDDGSHNSYTFSENTWIVYDKEGTRYTYGSSDAGRMYDTSTATSTKTYRWYLQEIRDTNNNYATYSYLRDGNVLYPYQITYTGNGSTDGPFNISFSTSTRPDIRTSYASAFDATINYRVSEINASVNGSVVRKYLLGYGAGHNGYRSLLTSIQQQGYDDNDNLTTLPPTTFTYASPSEQFYRSGGVQMVNGRAWVVADANGNGINDVNSFYYQDWGSFVNEKMVLDDTTTVSDTFTPPEWWANGLTSPLYGAERGTRYLDINADGKADVIRGFQNVTTGSEQLIQTVAINDSNSGSYSWNGYWAGTTTESTIPIFALQTGSGFIISGGVFGDVNGDGLPDYETYLPGFVAATGYLGNGSAWVGSTTIFAAAQAFPVSSPSATASQLVDVNGDGLDDWVSSGSNSTVVQLNTGTGWGSADPAWTIATSTLYDDPTSGAYYDRGIRFMDINGDQLPDFIRGYTVVNDSGCSDLSHGELGSAHIVYLNTGNGWASSSPASTAYSIPNIYYARAVSADACAWTDVSNNEMGNWTGNGQMKQDVITTVTNSKGGYTSVLYDYTTQLGNNIELPYSLLVVTETGTYDGLGGVASTTYSYSGGKQYTALGVRNRKFAGFSTTTATTPNSRVISLYHQGNSVATSSGEQLDGYTLINRPFRKDVTDLSSNLKQRTYYRWDTVSHGGSTFVGLGQELVQEFASDLSHTDRATAYSYSTSTNDLVRKIEYGEVSGNSDGTFSDIGTDKRTINITYAASSSVNMTVPIQTTLLDFNSTTKSDQKLYYDSLTLGQVTLGNNTRQEDWISDTVYASSTKTYNSYGLVTSATDRNGNTNTFTYDAYSLYVATTTNALSQETEQKAYAANSGRINIS